MLVIIAIALFLWFCWIKLDALNSNRINRMSISTEHHKLSLKLGVNLYDLDDKSYRDGIRAADAYDNYKCNGSYYMKMPLDSPVKLYSFMIGFYSVCSDKEYTMDYFMDVINSINDVNAIDAILPYNPSDYFLFKCFLLKKKDCLLKIILMHRNQ